MNSKSRRLHSCPVESCIKIFTSALDMQKHIKLHTEKRLYSCKCRGCSVHKISKKELKRRGERPHGCDREGCGKKFLVIEDLKAHMLTHDRKKHCAQPTHKELSDHNGSVQKNFVRRRKRKTSSKKVVECSCQNCLMKSNRIVNSKRRIVYSCFYQNCGKVFECFLNLKKHVGEHRNEQFFVCDWEGCEKKFIQENDLRTHKLSHEKGKNETCDISTPLTS